MAGRLRCAPPRHASAAGNIRALHGQIAGPRPISPLSIRDFVDARARRHPASWRSCARLLVDETGQKRLSTAIHADGARAARSADLWQLHLTAVPAGGSRSEQGLRAIREEGYFPGRVHHGSASERRLADGEQYQRQSCFCQP